MNGLITEILKESQIQITQFQKQMDRFETEPMILLTDIYKNNDVFLPFLIERYGTDVLLNVQEYWYKHFLPVLKNHIGVHELSFSYDKESYPAPINFHYKEEIIGVFNLITKEYYENESQEVIEYRERLNDLNEETERLNIELNEKLLLSENPLMLAGANVLKIVDISLRQKKYVKKINKELFSLNDEILELDKERVEVQVYLDNLEKNNIEKEYIKGKIAQRINSLSGFKIEQIQE